MCALGEIRSAAACAARYVCTYIFSNILQRMRAYMCSLCVYIYICIYIYLSVRVRMIHRGEMSAVNAVTTNFSSSPRRYVCTQSTVVNSPCYLTITGRRYAPLSVLSFFFLFFLGTRDAHAGVLVSTRYSTTHYKRCSPLLAHTI